MPIILESSSDQILSPLTDIEKDMIHKLRVLLKDVPEENLRSLNTLVEKQRGERWSDEILLVYLQCAVADLNSQPPATMYTLANLPQPWYACIITGGLIFSLVAESIAQNGESFSYADNGISLNINLSQGYQAIAQMLLTGYGQLKKDIKLSCRPQAAGLKSSPLPVHIRSYSSRQWCYR